MKAVNKMIRDYKGGASGTAVFFTGIEVEKTPAYGLPTLFVTGVHAVDEIAKHLNGCRHIFFGANHSFSPEDCREWTAWETMIKYFLELDYLCSLDIPLSAVESFNDGPLNSYNNFIPQIRVPVPYIKLWNYNTMLKIDDRGFNSTNPGVWTHSLHSLQSRDHFTDWAQYRDDQILK